jgi:hypothetical protein
MAVGKTVDFYCGSDNDWYQGKIFYEANRDIKKGEEITTDYGEEYFNQYIKPVGCRCVSCKAGDTK